MSSQQSSGSSSWAKDSSCADNIFWSSSSGISSGEIKLIESRTALTAPPILSVPHSSSYAREKTMPADLPLVRAVAVLTFPKNFLRSLVFFPQVGKRPLLFVSISDPVEFRVSGKPSISSIRRSKAACSSSSRSGLASGLLFARLYKRISASALFEFYDAYLGAKLIHSP